MRQDLHVKDSLVERGNSEPLAEAVAARVVTISGLNRGRALELYILRAGHGMQTAFSQAGCRRFIILFVARHLKTAKAPLSKSFLRSVQVGAPLAPFLEERPCVSRRQNGGASNAPPGKLYLFRAFL